MREASSCDKNGINQYSCALKLQNQSPRSIASSREQGNGTEGFDGASLLELLTSMSKSHKNRKTDDGEFFFLILERGYKYDAVDPNVSRRAQRQEKTLTDGAATSQRWRRKTDGTTPPELCSEAKEGRKGGCKYGSPDRDPARDPVQARRPVANLFLPYFDLFAFLKSPFRTIPRVRSISRSIIGFCFWFDHVAAHEYSRSKYVVTWTNRVVNRSG